MRHNKKDSIAQENLTVNIKTACFAIILLLFAQPSVATLTGPLPCAGVFGVGGCPPYGQVIYGTGGNDGSLFEYDSSTFTFSVTGPTASVSSMADLATGQLKAYAQGIEDGNVSTSSGGYIIVSATDVFTLHSSSATGLTNFTVVLTADGVGSITNPGYSGQATLQLGVPGGGGGDFDIGLYQAGNNAPLGTSFSLLSTLQSRQGNQLRASDTHSVLLDTPFSLSYSLRADVTQGTTFDLTNTGHLNFVLPEGVTITSMGGYTQTAVPVPASVWLFGSGLLGLIGVARCKVRMMTAS